MVVPETFSVGHIFITTYHLGPKSLAFVLDLNRRANDFIVKLSFYSVNEISVQFYKDFIKTLVELHWILLKLLSQKW